MLKASINAYKKISNKEELTPEDLKAMIYEFKDNVDKLEMELKDIKDNFEKNN